MQNENHDETESAPGGLYKTDEEIARLVGVGVDKWRAIVAVLEPKGLPRRDPLFCQRRYWPSVKAYLDRRNYLHAPPHQAWREYFDKPQENFAPPKVVRTPKPPRG